MKIVKAFVKGHPMLGYFALAFAISWGAILIVVGLGPGGFSATPEQFRAVFPYALPAMLLGPSVAGILMTCFLHGRAGLHELLSRLLRWRVGARWYAVALLAAPLLYGAVLLSLSLVSHAFLPGIVASDDKADILLMGIAAGLLAGIFEELGWTGFAVPTMRLRHGIFATGLIVGMLWTAWHFFANFWASGVTSGTVSPVVFLPAWLIGVLVGQLTAFRVLMVWVYDRTGSLLVAMLMHASLTTCTILFAPVGISGVAFLALGLAYGAATWVVVAAIALVQGGHLSRQPPLRRQVARERGSTQGVSN
jgi:uncharacterized protein